MIVAPITSTMRLAAAPGNVELEKGEGGLPKACVVNVSQTVVVDRSRLIESIGTLPAQLMTRVDDGLRLVLDL